MKIHFKIVRPLLAAVICGLLLAASDGKSAAIYETSSTITEPGSAESVSADSIPAMLTGDFQDDYGISYTVSDSLFLQHPGIRYEIIEWNKQQKYILAKNGANNPSERGLFTRIDYMSFEGMAPFEWGFCLTVFNATSDSAALRVAPADRNNPRKGCNGFPFSRMKRSS